MNSLSCFDWKSSLLISFTQHRNRTIIDRDDIDIRVVSHHAGWSAIGSTYASVQFDNFELAGMHDEGASAVQSCVAAGGMSSNVIVPGRAVESYPCDRPGASTRWVVVPGLGHVQHGAACLCMAASAEGDAVTLQVRNSTDSINHFHRNC
jgi:hypothetical protein